MISFYIPGESWLHRMPAGRKLAFLMLAGACLIWVHDWRVLLACLLATLWLIQQAAVPLKALWRHFRTLSWLVLALVVMTGFVQSPVVALEVGLRMVALLLGALLVSMTTTIGKLMGVVVWLLQPLHRLGWVDSERVALVLGLTLRMIPELSAQWQEIREAQAARGLKASPFTMGVPMLLRTLQRAQEMADALDARR